MVNIKRPQEAFAVRFDDKSLLGSLGRVRFFDFMQNIKKELPYMSVEGITTERRSNKEYKPLVELGSMALCAVEKHQQLICVGVSDKYDISFEKESDILLGGICPRIPIYNLNNPIHVEKVAELLAQYTVAAHPIESALTAMMRPAQPKRSCGNITVHSNFVRVGDQRMSHLEASPFIAGPKGISCPNNILGVNLQQLDTLLGKKKPQVKVTEKVTLPGVDPLGLLGKLLNLSH